MAGEGCDEAPAMMVDLGVDGGVPGCHR